MGMAASQARYIELTARKTNVEYEGQQINQQRTALANESAGLFNQMMALTVPTAPSSSDYTKTQYSFNDGTHDCTITDINTLSGNADYNASVSYYYTQSTDEGIIKTRNDLGVKNNSGTYWLTNGSTGEEQKQLTVVKSTDTNYADEVTTLEQVCSNNTDSQLAKDLGYVSSTGKIDETKVGNAYYYTSNGTTYYCSHTDLAAKTTPDGKNTTGVTLDNYYAATIKKKMFQNDIKADLETEDSGRYSSITVDGYSEAFDVNTKTTTDSNAYNDAMNEYNYQTEVYEQQINNINAKTEVIEKEDRTLEMKLAQLDTEQKALSTEMESVKKVIEKNIEATFKTFQS